jgi:hypothetical protein
MGHAVKKFEARPSTLEEAFKIIEAMQRVIDALQETVGDGEERGYRCPDTLDMFA